MGSFLDIPQRILINVTKHNYKDKISLLQDNTSEFVFSGFLGFVGLALKMPSGGRGHRFESYRAHQQIKWVSEQSLALFFVCDVFVTFL